jgi:hypothetical protein
VPAVAAAASSAARAAASFATLALVAVRRRVSSTPVWRRGRLENQVTL